MIPVPPEFEPLLAPIPGPAPGGASLRYERTYDLIREARREDDPSLPQGDWARKLKVADFALVERLCLEALQSRSKDLRIAAWLAEAWARSGGLAGATRGLTLFAAMLERCWEIAFPSLEEDGEEARADLISWVDDTLALALRRAPLGGTSQPPFRLEDWERAERGLLTAPGDDGDVLVTLEALRARISLLGEARWREIRVAADDVARAAALVHEVASARMKDAPALRRIRDVSSSVARLARDITGDSEMTTPSEPPPEETPPAAEGSPASGAEDSPRSGPIRSRAEAYLRLSEAADYLLRTEPHSPVPYLVKRAVGWGNLSLAELLMELVGSPDDLVTIQRLLGMRGRE
jgi:type VI secretion system protein ImpA